MPFWSVTAMRTVPEPLSGVEAVTVAVPVNVEGGGSARVWTAFKLEASCVGRSSWDRRRQHGVAKLSGADVPEVICEVISTPLTVMPLNGFGRHRTVGAAAHR